MSSAVGVIDVKTDAGSVTLDKAFEATVVTSAFAVPTPPVVLNIDESGVGNNLMLDSPKELGNGGQTVREKNDRDAQAAQRSEEHTS